MRSLTEPTPAAAVRPLPVEALSPGRFGLELYGPPSPEAGGLLESVRREGVLVPLVVNAGRDGTHEVLSGNRRLECARRLGLAEVPAAVVRLASAEERRRATIEYNRQRDKTFTQKMREATALESLLAAEARRRQWDNLAQNAEGRNSDARTAPKGRTDASVAQAVGLGGKDLYRQARAVWKAAEAGDVRAAAAVEALDAGTKSVHAAYKDLRRRDRFTAGFRPTPYDVWRFRHDRAFGVPHEGSIPPAIVAHALHYFSPPGGLVVDPMAGGGTTLDVATSMGRLCLAFDLHPARPDVSAHDITQGYPESCRGCDLVFADPPYHTMKARKYPGYGIGEAPLVSWKEFLRGFARTTFDILNPGGFVALLLANQTENDVPAGSGYIDHAFLGYEALAAAGFLPERRIHCPMDGAYLPQHIRRARVEGRLLGQVRDLLVMRKPG